MYLKIERTRDFYEIYNTLDPPGHPEIVAHGDPFARSNLELPLGGHHLRVGAAHVDPGVQTSPVNNIMKMSRDLPPYTYITWAVSMSLPYTFLAPTAQ